MEERKTLRFFTSIYKIQIEAIERKLFLKMSPLKIIK